MNPDVINYAFGIIGTILGIVGIVLTVRSTKRKEPAYSIKSVNVISDYSSVFRDLTVSYKDDKVENFTVSKVLFFNRGSEALDGNDISSLNPLRIIPKECNILDATVLAINNPSTGLAPSFDKVNQEIAIDFEYLNHHDGVVMAIIHTGVSSRDIDVIGDMKEVKGLIRIAPRFLQRRVTPFTRKNVIAWTVFILASFASAMGLLLTIWPASAVFAGAVVYVSTMAIGLLIAAVGRFVILSRITTIPKGLEIFDDDYYGFP